MPHFPQQMHQCGPAALASALAVAGVAATPEALSTWVFVESRQGSLPLDMLGAARRAGTLAVRIPPEVHAAFAEVAAGRPVIVLQNLSLFFRPLWHYAVLVGYDLERREVILRSGNEQRQVLSLRTFWHTWSRSERWAMVTLAPGVMPVDVETGQYVDAALALERLGHLPAARLAYEGGLRRWPSALPLWMGAGNTAYALQDRAAAEDWLRQAVERFPESVVALNNLAHLLAERGALDEALPLAERAAAAGGAHHAIAQATLTAIRQRLRGDATTGR